MSDQTLKQLYENNNKQKTFRAFSNNIDIFRIQKDLDS